MTGTKTSAKYSQEDSMIELSHEKHLLNEIELKRIEKETIKALRRKEFEESRRIASLIAHQAAVSADNEAIPTQNESFSVENKGFSYDFPIENVTKSVKIATEIEIEKTPQVNGEVEVVAEESNRKRRRAQAPVSNCLFTSILSNLNSIF